MFEQKVNSNKIKELKFILKVINSCESKEQIYSLEKWIFKLLPRFKPELGTKILFRYYNKVQEINSDYRCEVKS